MANVTWRSFHEHVMPNVHGCPIGIVNNAIRNAVIEFCEKSLLWKEIKSGVNVVAGQSSYEMAPPSEARVVKTVYASLNDTSLIRTSLDDLDTLHDGWRVLEQATPLWYYMDTSTSLALVGRPSENMSGALTYHMALKPSRVATGCPEFILEDWAETIANGAMARLHAMAGKEWAKVDLVGYHDQQFRAGIARAKSKAMRSWQNVPKTVIFRQFGDL